MRQLRRIGIVIVLAAIPVIAGLLALRPVGIAGAAETKGGMFKPVAPLEDLMSGIEDHFKALEKESGNAKSKTLKKDALVLAELFNVAKFHQSQKDYVDWATQARDALLKMPAAATKGDAAALKASVEALGKNCKACHDKYKKE